MTDLLDSNPETDGACSKPDCTFAADGLCILGNDVMECEHFEPTPDTDTESHEPEVAAISLPSGEALPASQLERLLGDTPSSVVVPLGVVKAGKTTLICLLFNQVRTRRSEPWRFTESRTVIGFARRSYDASMGSGRWSGTAQRTSLLESGLHLHLGLRDPDGLKRPIVFTDLSGEHVRRLADGTVEPVVAAALRRADHIPIVVNGRHIADPDRRASTIYSARSLLGMLDHQTVPEHACVCVVLTKGDLLMDVDTEAVLDEITRGTCAENHPRFVTADRESIPGDAGEPAVERGAGTDALLAHLALSPAPAVPVHWPLSSEPLASELLRQLWGSA